MMLLFVAFNGLFTLAANMNWLMIFRFMAGLPHGAFFGVASVVAAQLAKKGKEAQAISFVFTGMTVANLLGVPLGTYIGQHYSWRFTYAIISMSGLATIAAIYFWLPKIESKEKGQVFNQLKFFKTKKAWLLIAIISIGTGGLFSWLSYIAPLITEVGKLEAGKVPFIMTLVGLGMLIGNLLGGKVSDSISPTKAAIASFLAMVVSLFVVYYTVHIPFLAYTMAFVTGMVSFSIGSPLQMMLINNARGSETLAAAAGQASFNLGNTFGAYFGGLPIVYGFAYNAPLLVGMGMAFSGALLALNFLFLTRRNNSN